MRLLLLACALAAALAAPSRQKGFYEGHKLLTVTPVTQQQLTWLEKLREQDETVDFWSDPHLNQNVYIRVTPEAEAELLRLMGIMGLHYEVKLENLQTLVDLEAGAPDTFGPKSAVGNYVKTAKIYEFIADLGKNYPHLVTYQSIGQSYEGRQLFVTKYSTGEGRPAIFINSGMHSREWIAHASIVWIMNELATQYGSDADVTAFLEKYDVYIMPLVNPDGYDYSHDSERFWRKTRSKNGGWRDCRGTDPNRNFDIEFAGEGTSSNACSDIYHGPSAFSEPETAALVAFLKTIPDLYMYLDVHSYSQLWLTPYAYTHDRPSDAAEVDRVAEIGAKAILGVNGKEFTVGTAPSILYIAAGGSDDYAKAVLGIKYAYTLELRPDGGSMLGFIVPASQIPDSGRETMAGIIAAAMAMDI